MRTKSLKHFLPFLISLLPIMACSDKNDVKKGDLSAFAKQYLSMRLGTQDAAKNSQAGAINMSFNNLYHNYMQMGAGRAAGDSTINSEPGDSTIYGEPWVTCATVTETQNDDGSITTVTDYGTGCDEGWDDWKYRMWGKITSTYLYQNSFVGSVMQDTYSYNTAYDHFGGFYYSDSSEWETNGYSNYAGESSYDTTDYSFSGWYTYQDDNSYTWNDTMTYTYKSDGKTSYTNNRWITESADYEYSNGSDYYYKSSVLEPLVMDYTCTPPVMYLNGVKAEGDAAPSIYVMTYVSGIEDVTYRQGDESGHFTIDYGDGECDNIITITENGVTTVIDLAEYWKSGDVKAGVTVQ